MHVFVCSQMAWKSTQLQHKVPALPYESSVLHIPSTSISQSNVQPLSHVTPLGSEGPVVQAMTLCQVLLTYPLLHPLTCAHTTPAWCKQSAGAATPVSTCMQHHMQLLSGRCATHLQLEGSFQRDTHAQHIGQTSLCSRSIAFRIAEHTQHPHSNGQARRAPSLNL
jgi:hypothetical protein